MKLSQNLKRKIKEHALVESPNECCGLICKDYTIIQSENLSENPDKHFVIDAVKQIEAEEIGLLAFYHSQKSENPSELDKRVCKNLGVISVVYSIEFNKFTVIYPEKYFNKYIGIEFEFGKTDCFSLIRNYYKNELNIQIRDFKRSNDLFKHSPKIIEENFEKEGFAEVNKLQKHDLILFGYNGAEIRHLAIYLGDNTILHQQRNKKSTIEFFNKPLQKRVIKYIRHKNMF